MARAHVRTMFGPNVKLFVQLPLLWHVTHGYFKSKCNGSFEKSNIGTNLLQKYNNYNTNLSSFIDLCKIQFFINSYKNCMNSMLWLIWMIFVCIQYFKYLNKWNIIFEWHIWMFKFNTQNHIFICKIISQW
jgi:hypothetical protein